MCSFFACIKPHEPHPPKDCNCDASSFEAAFSDHGSSVFLRDYRYKKTYNPDGSVHNLYLLARFSSVDEYIGTAGKTGNLVYLLDSISQDTIFKAELNSQQQVVRSFIREDHRWQYYTYNALGQLIRFDRDSAHSDAYDITYDAYGEVSRYSLVRDPSKAITFTYDHSIPVKGADYFMDTYYSAFIDLEILQHLGYINLQAHHKVLSIDNPYFYPEYNRSFINQEINADGYVTAYETTLWYPDQVLRTRTYWHCKNKPSHLNY
jgi:hypothetical protein